MKNFICAPCMNASGVLVEKTFLAIDKIEAVLGFDASSTSGLPEEFAKHVHSIIIIGNANYFCSHTPSTVLRMIAAMDEENVEAS